MELTKRHKVLMGAASLGVGFLLVDRLILSKPSPSAASGAVPAPVMPTSGAIPDDVPQTPLTDGAAERLQQLAGRTAAETPETAAMVRDAFGSPATWAADGSQNKVVEPQDDASRLAAVAKQFSLTSVYAVGPGYAVISGSRLAVGQADPEKGIKLLSIDQGSKDSAASAVIEYRGHELRLTSGYAASSKAPNSERH